MFELGKISSEQFFEEYWRKKPLFIKGGARLLLDREISTPEFRVICDRLDRSHPGAVTRGSGFIFGQNIDQAAPELRQVSQAQEERLSIQRVWFDGVHAWSDGGIGCHYDHSDNFVLQQSGTKHWRLCSPEVLSAQELRNRMLDHPSAGLVHMPDECHDFLVEQGDLLYIPLFWGHWGISDGGPSMSVSLVLNADNALDLLLPALKEALSEEKPWWYPLPQLVRPSAGNPKMYPDPVDRCFEALIGSFSDPSFAARAKAAWWQHAYGSTRAQKEDVKANQASPYARTRRAVTWQDLELDPNKVEAFRRESDRLLPANAPAQDLVDRWARKVLRNFFDGVLMAQAVFPDCEATQVLVRLAGVLQDTPFPEATGRWARPELSLWMWRMSEALEFLHEAHYQDIAKSVVRLLVPAVLAVPSQGELRLPMEDVDESGMNLLGFGRRIIAPGPWGPGIEVTLGRDGLGWSSAQGDQVRVSREAMDHPSPPALVGGFGLEKLPVSGATLILDQDPFLFGQYPKGRRFGASPLGEGLVFETTQRLTLAMDQTWPELMEERDALLKIVLPLSGGSVQTVPPLPGAVAVGDRAVVADLVEALGQTKARILCDLGLVFQGSPTQRERTQFENAVARSYRRSFEYRAGHPLSEPYHPGDSWTSWAQAFWKTLPSAK